MEKKIIESSIVGIGRNTNEKKALNDAISYLPWDNFIKKDHCVTITANLVNDNPPEKGVTVGQNTLRELIKIIKQKQPKRIVLAGGSGGASTSKVFNELGYDRIVDDEDIEFIDLNSGEFIEIELDEGIVRKTKINRLIEDTDIMISFTQLKHHEEATMSASIKNIALSWPPAEEHGYPKKFKGIHEDLHSFIYAIAKAIKIDLAIVSLNPAMIGTGPSKGVPVHTGMIVSGMDAVAVDTICARLLGFRPQAINYLFRLIKAGVGQGSLDNIDVKGVGLVEAEKYFSKLAYQKSFSIDE